MFDTLVTNLQKLHRLYDAELKLSSVLVIIVIVASGIVAITIFDKQTRAFIRLLTSLYYKCSAFIITRRPRRRKEADDQKTGKPDYICPDCKVDMMARNGCRNYDGKEGQYLHYADS